MRGRLAGKSVPWGMAWSAFLRLPVLEGLRKNSAGSTSRMVANLPMISGPTQVTARSTRLK